MNGHKDLSQTDNSAFACFQFLYLETTRDALITGAPFRRDSLADYDEVVARKERLTAEVGDSANVDSHMKQKRLTSDCRRCQVRSAIGGWTSRAGGRTSD
jgi:hypothetical protein